MGNGIPDDWYIEHSGESRILDQDKVAAELDRRRSALASCASWLERWAKHFGNCAGGAKCTCGLTAVSFEANAALVDAE